MPCLRICLPAAALPPRPQKTGTQQRSMKQRIELNVGGLRFTTSRGTLSRHPNSLLCKLIEGEPEEDGVYFVDRDGKLFNFTLNFLRDGADNFVLPATEEARTALRHEAKQLGILGLVELLEDKTKKDSDNGKAGAADQEVSMCGGSGEGDVIGMYTGAPTPSNELDRLAKLDSLNQLYSQRESQYDTMTAVVAALLEVPIVLLSLVAKEEQWFKAKTGLEADNTPRNVSFCAFMLKPEQPTLASMLVIEDATRDPRVADNPLVTGEPRIRFYAGSPLVTSDGLRLGALCAIDRVARSLSPAQSQLLANFGQLAVQALEQAKLEERRPMQPHPEEEVTFVAGAYREARMRDSLKEMVVLVWVRPDDKTWTMMYANRPWTDETGLLVQPPVTFPGKAEVRPVNALKEVPLKNSLLEYLQVPPAEDQKLEQFQEVVKNVLSHPAGTLMEEPTFAISGSLRSKTGGSVRVLCRFTPADMPLDVAAAAVRPALMSKGGASYIHPKGYPTGLLYFVVMLRQGTMADEVEVPRPCTAPTGSTSTAAASASNTCAPSDESGSFANNGCRKLDLSSLRARSDRNTQGTSGEPGQASGPSRPPSSPYEDVRLLRMAGEGSFGKVYLGLWNGSAVAVKVISNLSTTHQKLTLSPEVEAELSSLISHVNLVKTYQYCTRTIRDPNVTAEDGSTRETTEMWIVQEWCDGGTLREYCKQPKVEGAGLLEALEIGLEIGRGIAYLHDRNIIHGDLTPNNVMLQVQACRKGYACKVCDFGRARIFDAETQEIMTRTMGTVTHMPPELFVTNIVECVLTPKADVYALGVILYEVVTAKCPFAGLSPPQVVLRVASGKRLELPKEVPAEMISVYQNCVSKAPKDRPSATDLIEKLEALFGKAAGIGPSEG
mmetsp:Transcript_97277/g.245427  ORF Transcript_97277/g.245427 Transcript_97277/m.245427 type:complete len:893 (-) Transcript_97277:211-2889(-)